MIKRRRFKLLSVSMAARLSKKSGKTAGKIFLPEMLRLYVDEKLSVMEVAVRLGVTKQAVYERLRKNSIALEKRPKTLDPVQLHQLYLIEGLSAGMVAKKLDAAQGTVQRELSRLGIKQPIGYIDPRSKFPQIANMKVGDSFRMERPPGAKPSFNCIYKPARRFGIRLSIARTEDGSYRVTRIE